MVLLGNFLIHISFTSISTDDTDEVKDMKADIGILDLDSAVEVGPVFIPSIPENSIPNPQETLKKLTTKLQQKIKHEKTVKIKSEPGEIKLKQENQRTEQIPVEDPDEPVECSTCHKSFKSNKGLQVHNRLVHQNKSTNRKRKRKSQNNQEDQIKIKKLSNGYSECPICFKSVFSLTEHSRTHTGKKPFKCRHNNCTQAFSLQGNRNRHEKTHSKTKTIKCKICDKEFKHRRYLKQHQVLHSETAAVPCKICGKTFTEFRNLKTHEKTVHSNLLKKKNGKGTKKAKLKRNSSSKRTSKKQGKHKKRIRRESSSNLNESETDMTDYTDTDTESEFSESFISYGEEDSENENEEKQMEQEMEDAAKYADKR